MLGLREVVVGFFFLMVENLDFVILVIFENEMVVIESFESIYL